MKAKTKAKIKIKKNMEPDYEAPIPVKPLKEVEDIPYYQWVDDHTLLREVVKTNKHFEGYGANKKFVTRYYGPLK